MNKKIISWGLFGVIILMFLLLLNPFKLELIEEIDEDWFIYAIYILILSIFFINFKLFFFGFLAKKWKRLIRTILIIVVISLLLYNQSRGRREMISYEDIALLFSFFCIPSISLISWVIKPFVVKEDS